jgi:hypothetical protein
LDAGVPTADCALITKAVGLSLIPSDGAEIATHAPLPIKDEEVQPPAVGERRQVEAGP